jgi:hypothetical protein
MLNFEQIANQLEADGHSDISHAVRAHGNCTYDLKAALEFSDQCSREESSAATGASRDARNWIMKAARDVCALPDNVGAVRHAASAAKRKPAAACP